MEQKKYMEIQRIKEKIIGGFEVGDHIIIQEKIDGANFSFRYDKETDTIKAYSRKRELDYKNNLRGAYEWSQQLDKQWVKTVLADRYIVFAEWLVKHTVPYPANKYNKAYVFDIYDVIEQKYLPQDKVKTIAKSLDLTLVPEFYDGEFISWEDIYNILGTTKMGGEYGEGVVVKNQTKLNDENARTPFYIKIVTEKFAEKHDVKEKTVDPEIVKERERKIALTESIVTEARVRKMLHKLIDESILPENWDEHNMKTIAQNLGKRIYEDCIKEEPEIVAEIGDTFGKFASSVSMKIVKTKIL